MAATNPPAYSSRPPEENRRARILVMLGKKRARDAVCDVLSADGHDVFPSAEFDQVYSVAAETVPDVIILDMDDGLTPQVCAELTQAPPESRACVLIARDGVVDEGRTALSLGNGADDVVDARRLREVSARVKVQLRNKRGVDALARVRKERDRLKSSLTDPLTGTHSRQSIAMALDRLVGQAERFSLLFLDLDHWKSINEDLGMTVGDIALKAVANHLRAQVRGADVCGRWAGEKFAVLLPLAGTDVAQMVAERHRAGISALTIPELRGRKITISIGVASFVPDCPDPNATAIERRADLALEGAKRNGRNRVVMAPPFVPANVIPLRRDSNAELLDSPGSIGAPRTPRNISVRSEGASPGASDEATEAELLSQLESGKSWLPVLPEAAERALSLGNDPTVDLARIAGMVEKDPPIAARFLAASNSAYYARAERVTTTLGAVVTLGLSATRDLLFQVVYESARRGLTRFRQEVTRSFDRSVVCAHACRIVARELSFGGEYSYLAGLLHDVGEARIYRILSLMAGPIGEEQARALVKAHHAQAGAGLAASWNLPDEIRDACALHHADVTEEGKAVKHIIFADILADLVTSGRTVRDLTKDEQATLDRGQVKRERLEAWLIATRRATGRDVGLRQLG
jgi:diguanylate cyclase (GGDEF)-like protein/putative nucleotidyltransferase with HDIG domain